MGVRRGAYKAVVDAWSAGRRRSVAHRGWSPDGLSTSLRAEVEPFEEAGLLDPRLLDGFQRDVAAKVSSAFAPVVAERRDAVGCEVAESVFGHTTYANRLDRQMAVGAAAVADLVMEELVWLAAADVARRLCGSRAGLVPALPRGASFDASPDDAVEVAS